MTIWTPELAARSGPRYRAIAEALAADVESGTLVAGERLPTHRELADRLGLTVGTVTRAYSEARARGLISGEVGRGTFVSRRRPGSDFSIPEDPAQGDVDLSLNIAPRERRGDLLSQRLIELAGDPALPDWCTYQNHSGHRRHREIAGEWLGELEVEADAEQLVMTAGAQHGLAIAFTALAGRGDAVLTESLTYPGIQWIAQQRGLRLEGVAMDDEGMCPDALRERARQTGARVLFCTPSLQNPTATIMSEGRREQVAAVAREFDLQIVEDDVYRPMFESPPRALSDFAPERSVFVTSFSKAVAPGLRVGVVRVPSARVDELAAVVRTDMWMVSPLMAELACRLVESGDADRMTAWKRREARERHALATRVLSAHPHRGNPASYHLWLPLAPPARASERVAAALARGVRLSGSDTFAVGSVHDEGLRISLLSPTTTPALERALLSVAELLAEPAVPTPSVL